MQILLREFKKGAKNIFGKLNKIIDEIFGFGEEVSDHALADAEKRWKRRQRKIEERKSISKRRAERKARSRLFKEINEKTVKLFRVQGGEVPNASRYRFSVKGEEIIIDGNERLYVTFKDEDRVLEFWTKRGNTAEVFTADVSESFFEKLMNDAVKQSQGKRFPNRPQFGDATKTKYSLGIPSNYFEQLIDHMSNVEILKFK